MVRNKTTVTDPEGNRKISYQDMRDNLLKIEQFNGGKMITTRYEYDLLKQITAVIDTKGNRTHITYDSLGRRTSINNPDSGLIEYFFDINGNLIKKTDPNLRKKSAGILYTYQYNRLEKIDYPDKKDVEYSYGAPGAVNNTAGRLLSITGESGTTVFEYGLLGQQTRIIKTLNRLAPSAPQLTYESSYGFDYLGRMEWIRYPDKETVYYEYDRGGQVRSVYGEHRGTRFDYIKQIHYDSFGQRVYLKYGNNVETRYTYDEQRRWLSNLNTVNASGKVFQAIDYTFDKVGNILIMENSAALKTSRQEFAYDDLYQLTGAKGIYLDKTIAALKKRNEYTQTYVYDDIGNLTHKTSYNYKWPDNSKPEHLNYNLAYHYAAAHPHRATRIGEMYYTYDGNGNVIRISNKPGDGQSSSNSNSDTFSPPFDTGANTGWAGVAYGREPGGNGGNEQSTQYKWDEENRLIHAKVNGNEIDFLYNAGGERTAKQGKDGEVIYYDKMFQVKTNVSPLHITKHIFLGSARVVSKLSHELGPIDLEYEKRNAYYYHGDHLGSSNYVTDYEGNEYEHYEYTPYGEMWVEEESDSLDKINFKFTSKELDEETGLYYFGARYLDAKTSRWLSCDPAFEEYLPTGNKKQDSNLPGLGGLFNPVNLTLYNYAGNNPLIYIDPDGRKIISFIANLFLSKEEKGKRILISTGDTLFMKAISGTMFSKVDSAFGKMLKPYAKAKAYMKLTKFGLQQLAYTKSLEHMMIMEETKSDYNRVLAKYKVVYWQFVQVYASEMFDKEIDFDKQLAGKTMKLIDDYYELVNELCNEELGFEFRLTPENAVKNFREASNDLYDFLKEHPEYLNDNALKPSELKYEEE